MHYYVVDKDSLKHEIDDLTSEAQQKRTILLQKQQELYTLMLKKEVVYEEEEGEEEHINKDQIMQQQALRQHNEKVKRDKALKVEHQILNACGVVQKLIKQLKINDNERMPQQQQNNFKSVSVTEK